MQERQEERQGAMALLEAELSSLREQKARLEDKNKALEQSMRMREQQKKFDAIPADFDPQYFVSCIIKIQEMPVGNPLDCMHSPQCKIHLLRIQILLGTL